MSDSGSGGAQQPNDQLARRNALTLACAQALGGSSPAIVISLGGIVGHQLAENKALATMPVSLLNLGIAVGVIPAALLMRKHGRRFGYMVGGFIGVCGGAMAAMGIRLESFALFCIATFVAGWYGAFVQSYRFAAADSATEGFKARAISWVMIGGLAAAIIGPQSVTLTRDMTPTTPFAASFLAQAFLAFLAIFVVSRLRAPPPVAPGPYRGRPLGLIMRQPRFIVAAVAALVSYGLMSFVMTAAPLAMLGCNHSIADATGGISLHILAMFGPSFFTGNLIDRFGKPAVTGAGLLLIAAAAIIGLSGLSVAHFWVALVLLGVGWNFGFIGATAMLTDCYRPDERIKVQAANDFLVFGATALASFMSGSILSGAGWASVNMLVFPAVAVALALLMWQSTQAKPA
ncbi:MAG: MFS transporter [Bosea sp. (in: a-proteobacteria)]